MKGVRWNELDLWEGKCDGCLEWWPLEPEFWYPRQGVRRCRACLREQTQQANHVRRADPVYRAAEAANQREKRAVNRDRELTRRREWYARNADRISAKYHADPQPKRAAMRARYQERRVELLTIQRAKRAEEARRRAKAEWKREHRVAA